MLIAQKPTTGVATISSTDLKHSILPKPNRMRPGPLHANCASSANTCRRRSSTGDTDAVNRQYQEQWERDTRGVKHGRDVAVLLFSWERQREHSMNTTAELHDLAEVFTNKYNFKVHTELLSTEKPIAPRHQLQQALINFLSVNDKPGTLLIIYYGGHGLHTEDREDLRLLGASPSEYRPDSTELNWSHVEPLLYRLNADLLLIFDCCYAGLMDRFKRKWPESRSHFEFIASTEFDKTAHGPRSTASFTRTMIKAFNDLADESEPFTTTTLINKIREYKVFRKTLQQPFISECGKTNSFSRLKITPCVRPLTPESSPPYDDDEELNFYVRLKYVFHGKPSYDHIKTLGETLVDIVKNDSLPVSHAVWDGLSECNPRMSMADVVHKLLALDHRARFEISTGEGVPRTKNLQRTLTTLTVDKDSAADLYPASKRMKVDGENKSGGS